MRNLQGAGRRLVLLAFTFAFAFACGGGGKTTSEPVTPPPPPPPAAVASVSVALGAASLLVGGTTTASATLRDASSNTLTGRTITWSSSAASVATVDATGAVRALAPGNATITATSEGVNGTAALTVTAPPVADPHVGAITDASDKIAALQGGTASARRQDMLTWLKSRVEFEAAGATEDGSLWARFTDGRLFLIIANQDPVTAPLNAPQLLPNLAPAHREAATPFGTSSFASPRTLPSASAFGPRRSTASFASSSSMRAQGPPAELPRSTQARFYLGGEPQTYPTDIPQLKTMVAMRNYTLAPNAGIGGVDDLWAVSGDAIFYWTTHGGHGTKKDGSEEYTVLTATTVSTINDLRFQDDWDNQRLVYATKVTRSWLPWVGTRGVYYGINAKFVTAHMSFAKDSFVWMGACSAGSAFAAPFIFALQQAGAGVVAAWNYSFSGGKDGEAALYVFDRMLGLNFYLPESPSQRPFDYVSIKKDMNSNDKETQDDGIISELMFLPGSKGPSGLLAPSIQYMYMDEQNDLLILSGKFGSEMGRAEVGGQARPIKSWASEKVEIEMPVTGAGSAGEVVVWSRERKSNVRPLTDWRGEFIWSFVEGHGTLKFEGPIRVHLRADVHTYRDEHHEVPKYRKLVNFLCARDTDGEVTGSGEFAVPNSSTTQWRGTAVLTNRILQQTGPNIIDCLGEIDTEIKQLRLVLFVSAQQGMQIISIPGGTSAFPAVWAYADGPLLGTNPVPSMYLSLTQDYRIIAGSRRQAPTSPSQFLDWGFITPTKIPADSMARLRVGPVQAPSGIHR